MNTSTLTNQLDLVVLKSASASVPLPVAIDVEPEFRWSGTKRLRLDPGGNQSDTLTYLAYRVVRSPADLRSHVRRIFVCGAHDARDELYGALQDLFIALDGRGKRLRRRLLYSAKSRLDPADFAALERSLRAEDGVLQKLPQSPRSVLRGGPAASSRLVAALASGAANDDDPLAVARAHVEFSQLEQARGVLERAIMLQPMREELQLDLIDLYKSTRDKDNFRKTLKQIDLSHNPVPHAWEDAVHFFQVTTEHAG